MNQPITKLGRQATAHSSSHVTRVNQGALMRAMWSGPMRALWARLFGNPQQTRNYYDVFGWDVNITPDMLFEMYHRGGIAERIIHAYPDEIWANPADLYADSSGNDEWTKAWRDIEGGTNIWEAVWRADRLSRIARYSIILVGTNKGNLSQPLRNASEILYLQPYSERAARITAYETDPKSPRFNLPLEYTIYPEVDDNAKRSSTISPDGSAPMRGSFKVHHSRVIHIAQGVLEDEVFGTPMFGSIWNYLTDLQKVVGGSAESYWLTANRGMQVDVDKDMELNEDDAAALSEEIDEYSHQMRRVLRTRGVQIKDLGSRVADPRGPYTTLVQLISGSKAIPQRILLGSEAGHLASTQDKGNWAGQVENVRALESEPRILRPMLMFFQNAGLLPEPKDDVIADWPDAFRSSPVERAEIASKVALSANNLGLMVKNLSSPQANPNQPAQGSPQRQPTAPNGTEGSNQGQPGRRIQADQATEASAQDKTLKEGPLLEREEMRAILGFSTDNAVLKDTPLGQVGTQKRVVLRAKRQRGS